MNKFMILAGIWTCILIGGFTAIMLMEDRKGPTITVNSSDIVYKQGEDKDSLLSFVTAMDEKDGDVTESVMVADILPLLDRSSAKVVYVAEDKSNNVAKKEVFVTYEPLEETPQVSAATEGEAVVAFNTSSGDTKNVAGENETISGGADRNEETEKGSEEEEAKEANPTLILVSNEHSIERREEFEPKDRIESVSDDKDLVNYLMEHITVVGNYDVNTRGDYVLMYYATDSDGNESERLYLVLTVE